MQAMYMPTNNGPTTTISANIGATTKTINLTDGTLFPPAPNVLTIGTGESAELVLYTAKNDNILTVTRGFNGTTAAAWPAGTIIGRYITAQDMSAVQANVAEIRNETLRSNVTYYVNSAAGSDETGAGTSALPFATINHALSLIPNNLGGFRAIIRQTDTENIETVSISNYFNGQLQILASNTSFVAVSCVNCSATITLTLGSLVYDPAKHTYADNSALLSVNNCTNITCNCPSWTGNNTSGARVRGLYATYNSFVTITGGSSTSTMAFNNCSYAVLVMSGSKAYCNSFFAGAENGRVIYSSAATIILTKPITDMTIGSTVFTTEAGGEIILGAQPEFSFAGIPKYDGVGNTSQAIAGTDYAAPATAVTATLTASGWANGVQTLSVAGVTASSIGSLRITQSATAAQVEAWGAAQPRVTAQAAGSITVTAAGVVPSINIPVEVVLL